MKTYLYLRTYVQKYLGREEEFLRFVYHKYDVTPPPPKPKPTVASSITPIDSSAGATGADGSGGIPGPARGLGLARDSSGSLVPKPPPTDGNSKVAERGKRYSSRSLSPPGMSLLIYSLHWCSVCLSYSYFIFFFVLCSVGVLAT